MGNIEADVDGVVEVLKYDEMISLDADSVHFVGNRSIIIHAEEDDLELNEDVGSKTDGNSGHRVACGIIQLCKEDW